MNAFTIIDAEQRTPIWYAARLGNLTGSVAGDMLAKIKSGEAASRRNLRLRLVLERLTGKSMESDFISPAMQAGIDREADAVAAYEALTGNLVRRTGFLAHPTLRAGCSLDGHLGDFQALLSVKCRQPAAHLDFLRSGTIPADALAQMRHELWITGAASHEYFSWNPDFPDTLQARVVTLARDAADLAGYDADARAFLAEVDRDEAAVRTLADVGAQLRSAVA